jgi:hypothetical protein
VPKRDPRTSVLSVRRRKTPMSCAKWPAIDFIDFQTNMPALNAAERTAVGDAGAAVVVRERLSAPCRFRYCTDMWSRHPVVVSLFRRDAAVRNLNSTRWTP